MGFDGDLLPYALPDQAVCFFDEVPEINEKWTEENGRPIYDRVIVVTIKARGQKTSEASYRLVQIFPDDGEIGTDKKPISHRKIYANIMNRPGVKEAFKAWESKQELAANGTPLETWPILNRTQVKSLKHVNVFTVEQLAELPDGALANTGLGLQARDFRGKAQAYLTQAVDGAAMAKLAGRLEKLEQARETDKARIQELEQENARLRAKKGKGAGVTEETAPPAAPEEETGAPVRGKGGRFLATKPKPPTELDDPTNDVKAALADATTAAEEDEDFI